MPSKDLAIGCKLFFEFLLVKRQFGKSYSSNLSLQMNRQCFDFNLNFQDIH